MRKLNWKREIFDKTTKLIENNSERGRLIYENFSNLTTIKIQDEKFVFYKPDFLSQMIMIKDSSKKEIIGNIRYDFWKTKAYIKLNESEYSLKNDSFWKGKWSLSEKSKKIIEFESKSPNGIIRTSIENDLLLFTGLYITNNYQRGYLILFFIIIIIPIIMRN
jgi:hypothetical protein